MIGQLGNDSDAVKKKRRRWREDEYAAQVKLCSTVEALVERCVQDGKKRFQETMAEERALLQTKYGRKARVVELFVASYSAEVTLMRSLRVSFKLLA